MVVLVDSWATNNFISLELVRELDLQIQATKQFGVLLGEGRRIASERISKKVTLELPSISLAWIFLPFQLDSVVPYWELNSYGH